MRSKTVTIITHEGHPAPPHLLATLRWDEASGAIDCDPPEMLDVLEDFGDGIALPDGTRVFASDGERFLDALPFKYSGLVRAEIIESHKSPTP